jgi:hypothetical protein
MVDERSLKGVLIRLLRKIGTVRELFSDEDGEETIPRAPFIFIRKN